MAEHQPLKTFICYAHEDRKTVEGLLKHLALLEKKLILEVWDDGKILAGEEWDRSIKVRLESAELILMFVSVDFINSDYIEKTELQAALQRHREGKATLIPVIVRSCDWSEYFEIGKFQALPQQARPIQSNHFSFLDDAYHEVAQGIKGVALDIREKRLVSQRAAEEEVASQARTKRKRQLDEAAWATAMQEAEKSKTEREKIAVFEVYLDDEGHALHRKEAEKQIAELKSAETKRKIEEKKKQEAAREAEEKKRQEEEAKKSREEEIKRKKQDEVVVKPVTTPVSLFPLYGVTLGKTTVVELAKLGEHAKDIYSVTGKPYEYYKINQTNFWYQKGVAYHMYISTPKNIPDKWQQTGFNWSLSYRGWNELFHKLGYQVIIVRKPSVKEYDGMGCFSAEIKARYSLEDIKYSIELHFNYKKGSTKEDDNGTLYSIRVRVE